MALEGGGLLSVQDEPTHPAVELSRQQQTDDGGLDVLLLILVGVEGVPQVCRDVIWKKMTSICAPFNKCVHAEMLRRRDLFLN